MEVYFWYLPIQALATHANGICVFYKYIYIEYICLRMSFAKLQTRSSSSTVNVSLSVGVSLANIYICIYPKCANLYIFCVNQTPTIFSCERPQRGKLANSKSSTSSERCSMLDARLSMLGIKTRAESRLQISSGRDITLSARFTSAHAQRSPLITKAIFKNNSNISK